MAFSNRIAKSCVHLGVVQMIFGIAGVACGAVVKSKLTGPVGATVGLWAAYFLLAGLVLLAGGCFKESKLHCLSLFFQIIGLFIAGAGLVISGLFWAFLNTCASPFAVGEIVDICPCGVVGDLTNYDISCSELKTIRNITIASTLVYLVLEITSFIGVVYGCIGTCCVSKEPRTVAVTKANSPSTSQAESKPMIMTKLFGKQTQPATSKKTKSKR